MLCTAIVAAAGGPLCEYWSVQDYWQPEYLLHINLGQWTFGLEDIAAGCLVSAFSVAVFELVAGRNDEPGASSRLATCLLRMYAPCIVGLALMVAVSAVSSINSIWRAVIIAYVLSAVMLSRRLDLVRPAIVTAVVGGFVMWVCYAGFWLLVYPGLVRAWWHDDAIVMLLPGGVPITEVIWAVAAAAFIGPLYRLSSSGSPNSRTSPCGGATMPNDGR